MEGGALVFWLGLAGLFGVALVLRRFATEHRQASPHRAATGSAATGRVVRRFRRGQVRLSVWTDQSRAGTAARHHVTVDWRGPDCDDCMDCVNQALRWIQECEARA